MTILDSSKTSVDQTTMHCPRCSTALAYRLDANEGGGLRYEVACPSCGGLYFEFCAPTVAST